MGNSRNGVGRVALAYGFLLIDLNLGTLNLLPNWAGYVLIFSAIPLLKDLLPDLPLLKPLCLLMVGADLIDWAAILTTGVPVLQQSFLIRAVMTCIAMYLTFQLLTDLAQLSKRFGLTGERLLVCRNLDVLLRAFLFLPLPWDRLTPLALLLVIAGVGVCIMIFIDLISLYRSFPEEAI